MVWHRPPGGGRRHPIASCTFLRPSASDSEVNSAAHGGGPRGAAAAPLAHSRTGLAGALQRLRRHVVVRFPRPLASPPSLRAVTRTFPDTRLHRPRPAPRVALRKAGPAAARPGAEPLLHPRGPDPRELEPGSVVLGRTAALPAIPGYLLPSPGAIPRPRPLQSPRGSSASSRIPPPTRPRPTPRRSDRARQARLHAPLPMIATHPGPGLC